MLLNTYFEGGTVRNALVVSLGLLALSGKANIKQSDKKE